MTKKDEQQKELKAFIKEFNGLSKEHAKMKNAISATSHDLALLKAIYKYEKSTQTRPEQVYMENVKKSLTRNMEELRAVYAPKKLITVGDLERIK